MHAVEHHVPGGSREMVHSAHGHTIDEMRACLMQRYCVVKIHEFLPDVLIRADAVFLTHRDPRDVLISSVQKLESCLLHGSQPLLPAFINYATWAPYACHDMQYEQMLRQGDHATIRQHLSALGLKMSARHAGFLATQLGELMRGGTVPRELQTEAGLMHGHVSRRATLSDARRTRQRQLGRLPQICNVSAELLHVERGFGLWLK
eukprot:1750637-Prymnesium_polylepis.1